MARWSQDRGARNPRHACERAAGAFRRKAPGFRWQLCCQAEARPQAGRSPAERTPGPGPLVRCPGSRSPASLGEREPVSSPTEGWLLTAAPGIFDSGAPASAWQLRCRRTPVRSARRARADGGARTFGPVPRFPQPRSGEREPVSSPTEGWLLTAGAASRLRVPACALRAQQEPVRSARRARADGRARAESPEPGKM